MSVLLWWVPAVVVLALAWWRLRPSSRVARDKDLRRVQQALRGDR